jgi:hypothetical protein
MTKSSTQGCEFNPGAEISTLLQLAGLKFQPWVENFVTAGVEIVHVIAKNFNPDSRAEFNPRAESAPCNRPLKDTYCEREQSHNCKVLHAIRHVAIFATSET